MHAENNEYGVYKIDEYTYNGYIVNKDDLYIAIFTSYVSTDYESIPMVDIVSLQKSLRNLKRDMRKLGLWNKKKFGVHTILSSM